MNAKKILFPTDFSGPSDAGLAYATSLARDCGAKLVVLHVEEPPMAYGGGEMYYGLPEPDTKALEEMLHAVVPLVSDVPCEHHMVPGDPAVEIAQFAKDEDIDLIVMGTHGRTGLRRLVMGSVAEAVVRRAHCPVFTYKEPHDAAVQDESK
jgi:universal stress protein A